MFFFYATRKKKLAAPLKDGHAKESNANRCVGSKFMDLSAHV